MSFLAGRSIFSWLEHISRKGNVREEVVWDVVYLSFSIYKLYDFYLRPEVFQTLPYLVDHLDPDIGTR